MLFLSLCVNFKRATVVVYLIHTVCDGHYAISTLPHCVVVVCVCVHVGTVAL